VQKWTASAFQSDPFTERTKVKSSCIKPEFESVTEFAALNYDSRDCVQNRLAPIALFGRRGIQITCEWAGLAHVHVSLFSILTMPEGPPASAGQNPRARAVMSSTTGN
jgi:hypothetical protein